MNRFGPSGPGSPGTNVPNPGPSFEPGAETLPCGKPAAALPRRNRGGRGPGPEPPPADTALAGRGDPPRLPEAPPDAPCGPARNGASSRREDGHRLRIPRARFVAAAHRAVAGVLLLLGALGVLGSAEGQTLVWEATLTAGTSDSGNRVGFQRNIGADQGYGSLSNDDDIRFRRASLALSSVYMESGNLIVVTTGTIGGVLRSGWTIHFSNLATSERVSFAEDAQNGSFSTTSFAADGCHGCSRWELSSPGFSFTDGASFRVWITTTRPGAPQIVRAIEFNPGHISEFPPTVVLSWSAPRSTGGTPITGYRYRYSSPPDFGLSGWFEVPGGGSATSVLFGRPVESSELYLAQMVATNDAGDGEYSNSSVQSSSEVSPSGISSIVAGNGNIINMHTKEAGFTIRGKTRRPPFGHSADLSVVVWVGTGVLTTTTVAGHSWSVRVPATAPYITEPSVTVTGITTWPGFAAESVQVVARVDLTPPR